MERKTKALYIFLLFSFVLFFCSCSSSSSSADAVSYINKVAFIIDDSIAAKNLEYGFLDAQVDEWRYAAKPLFTRNGVEGVKNPTPLKLENNYCEVSGKFYEGNWLFELYGYNAGRKTFKLSAYYEMKRDAENAVVFKLFDKNNAGYISAEVSSPVYSHASTFAVMEYRMLESGEEFSVINFGSTETGEGRYAYAGTTGALKEGRYECVLKVYTNSVIINTQRIIVSVVGGCTSYITGNLDSGSYLKTDMEILLSSDMDGELTANKEICPIGEQIAFSFVSTGSVKPEFLYWFVDGGNGESVSYRTSDEYAFAFSPVSEGSYICTVFAINGNNGISRSIEFSTN